MDVVSTQAGEHRAFVHVNTSRQVSGNLDRAVNKHVGVLHNFHAAGEVNALFQAATQVGAVAGDGHGIELAVAGLPDMYAYAFVVVDSGARGSIGSNES